jgi:hypothetical protein
MILKWSLIAFLLIVPQAFSQAPASGQPDLRQNVEIGQKVAVRLADGREFKGSVLGITEGELAIATKGRTETIPTARIEEVTRRRNDSLWNGVIIGGAVGAVLGWASLAANDCDFNECGEAGAVPGGIALGAGVGAGIDLLRRQKQVLYRRSPTKTTLSFDLTLGQVKGATVSWRF